MSATPLSFRFDEQDLAIIDRAAKLRGHSRTQFVRDAAVRAAEEAIYDATVIKLSPEDWAMVEDMLANPGEPSEKLKALMRKRPAWEN